jgi:ABC-type arginine transport system ATPase subunit
MVVGAPGRTLQAAQKQQRQQRLQKSHLQVQLTVVDGLVSGPGRTLQATQKQQRQQRQQKLYRSQLQAQLDVDDQVVRASPALPISAFALFSIM